MSEVVQGIVTQIVGNLSSVSTSENVKITCELRGKIFRKLNKRLAVGDRVSVKLDDKDDSRGVIESIAKRKTELRRPRESKRDQILCANVDQVFVCSAAVHPQYNKGFLDRVLIAVEREGLQASIVINKIDLLEDSEHLELIIEDLAIYQELGYPLILLSAHGELNLDELRDAMIDQVSVFTGPSGVGKSTLLNSLIPGLDLRTGEIGKSGKGRHITTSAQLLEVPQGGFVVDTPGIRAFGIQDLEPRDLAKYFPEFAEIQQQCRFRDCKHLDEPGCAVIEALEEGEIDLGRYESYVKILEDLEDAPRRGERRYGKGR